MAFFAPLQLRKRKSTSAASTARTITRLIHFFFLRGIGTLGAAPFCSFCGAAGCEAVSCLTWVVSILLTPLPYDWPGRRKDRGPWNDPKNARAERARDVPRLQAPDARARGAEKRRGTACRPP